MNAAARLIQQSTLSRTWVFSVVLDRTNFFYIALLVTLLTSALSIVYVSNSTRTLNAVIQQTFAERNQLHLQASQLLLEKSSFLRQTRVQQIAENNLEMMLPENKSVVIVKE